MKRDHLMKEIAETGYNVGYAAKKHLATFDIADKAPGWVTLLTLTIGIFALVISKLEDHLVGATVLVIGVVSLYINTYVDIRGTYERAGVRLTQIFTELRALYNEAKGRDPDAAVDDLKERFVILQNESQVIGISKQIFMSDWYAHYKFFWQAQTGWLDEQLHFSFWRDKVPLSASVTGAILLIVAAYETVTTLLAIAQAHFC